MPPGMLLMFACDAAGPLRKGDALEVVGKDLRKTEFPTPSPTTLGFAYVFAAHNENFIVHPIKLIEVNIVYA